MVSILRACSLPTSTVGTEEDKGTPAAGKAGMDWHSTDLEKGKEQGGHWGTGNAGSAPAAL